MQDIEVTACTGGCIKLPEVYSCIQSHVVLSIQYNNLFHVDSQRNNSIFYMYVIIVIVLYMTCYIHYWL